VEALPTNKEAIQKARQENTNNPLLFAASRNMGPLSHPAINQKRAPPELKMRMRQALLDLAFSTEHTRDLSKVDDLYPLLTRLRAVREELAAGHLNSISELAHAAVFDDLLDQTRHLFDEGYLVPAAVMAGSAGEAHQKRLAVKNGVAIVDGQGKALKADTINGALGKHGGYDKTVQKQSPLGRAPGTMPLTAMSLK